MSARGPGEPARGPEGLSPREADLLEALLSEGPEEEAPPPPGPGSLSPAFYEAYAAQQAAHGLLRSLQGADAAAAEARLRRVMAGVRQERSEEAGGAAAHPPGRPSAVGLRLAAALFLVAASVALVLHLGPADLPVAHAVVDRARARLEEPLDREYRGRFLMELAGEEQEILGRAFTFFVGGRGRFLLEASTNFGTFRIAISGDRSWVQIPGAEPMERTGAGALPMPGGLDLDDSLLRLDAVLARLAEDFTLATVGRTQSPDGLAVVHVTALPVRASARCRIARIELQAEEKTGILRRVEVLTDGRSTHAGTARGRLILELVRTLDLPPSFYELR